MLVSMCDYMLGIAFVCGVQNSCCFMRDLNHEKLTTVLILYVNLLIFWSVHRDYLLCHHLQIFMEALSLDWMKLSDWNYPALSLDCWKLCQWLDSLSSLARLFEALWLELLSSLSRLIQALWLDSSKLSHYFDSHNYWHPFNSKSRVWALRCAVDWLKLSH